MIRGSPVHDICLSVSVLTEWAVSRGEDNVTTRPRPSQSGAAPLLYRCNTVLLTYTAQITGLAGLKSHCGEMFSGKRDSTASPAAQGLEPSWSAPVNQTAQVAAFGGL